MFCHLVPWPKGVIPPVFPVSITGSSCFRCPSSQSAHLLSTLLGRGLPVGMTSSHIAESMKESRSGPGKGPDSARSSTSKPQRRNAPWARDRKRLRWCTAVWEASPAPEASPLVDIPDFGGFIPLIDLVAELNSCGPS